MPLWGCCRAKARGRREAVCDVLLRVCVRVVGGSQTGIRVRGHRVKCGRMKFRGQTPAAGTPCWTKTRCRWTAVQNRRC